MTGVLPIALDEATKVTRALLMAGKEYTGVMKLHSQTSDDSVKNAFKEFCGTIYQRPPLRSSVRRRLRTRKIYYLQLLERRERNILFRVGCEAGTYIRKLIHDLGEVLGTGAHMQELRRIRAGPFVEDKGSVTLHALSYAVIRWHETGNEDQIRRVISPMEKTFESTPKIYIRKSAIAAICHGAHLAAPGVTSLETGINQGDLVAIFTQKQEVVALGEAQRTTEEILEMDHGLVARTLRVMMPRDKYPRMWRTTPES